MATVPVRTWEVTASGRRIDTGIDERWDGSSGSYDTVNPAAYKQAKDHAYWFGQGRDGEVVTVPADEDEAGRPRRFFVTVTGKRREPVYPSSPKKGHLASPLMPPGRPFADGASHDFGWTDPSKAKPSGKTTIREHSDRITVGAATELPAAPSRTAQGKPSAASAPSAAKAKAAPAKPAPPARAKAKPAPAAPKAKPKAAAKARVASKPKRKTAAKARVAARPKPKRGKSAAAAGNRRPAAKAAKRTAKARKPARR